MVLLLLVRSIIAKSMEVTAREESQRLDQVEDSNDETELA